MDPVIHLEIVDQSDRVVHRIPIDATTFPLTIRLANAAGAQVTMPDTTPEAHLDAFPASVASRLTPRALAGAAAIVMLAVFALYTWTQSFTARNAAGIFGAGLGSLILLLLYTSGWAIAGRMAGRGARFARQFLWACAGALAGLAITIFGEWLLFLFPTPALYLLLGLLWAAIVVVMIFGHLTVMSVSTSRSRWRAAIGSTVAIVGLVTLIGYSSRNDFSSKLEYSGSLQPLAARFIPSESIDGFTTDVGDLKKEIDASARAH